MGWTSGGVVARDFVNGRARWPEGTMGGIAPQARTGPKSTPTERLIYYISRKNLEATNRHYSGL